MQISKYLSREQIEQLACGDSDDLITFITENENVFLMTYSQQRCFSHPLTLKYLIKLLYLLVTSEDELAARIVAHVFNDADSGSRGTVAFRSSLEMLIKKIPAETRSHIKRENSQYLRYIVEIGKYAIETVPMSVLYTFPSLSLNNTVQRLTQIGGDNLGLLAEEAQALDDKFTRAQTPQPRSINASYGAQARSQGQPPEHFTQLPVLPSADEVHPDARKTFVRPNITKGAYTDWEHYLDVQFRLMREDFIAPLRDGIRHYERHRAKNKEVMVYEGVSVGGTICLHSGVGFQIRFDVTRFRRMNWEHSKRLIFGSLLCLSDDSFYTIFLATVVKRDPKLLKDGLVTVRFETDALEEVLQIDPSRRFTMVESTAYFEAYRHILEGLQRASAENLTEQLPIFKRYLVDCKLNPPVPAPRYIRCSENLEFQLKNVLDITRRINPNVVLTDYLSWPAHKYTSLDPSQLSAFRAALTQEVSVIQGPPGTGKTFIGLKIVEALVANQHKSSHFPLLVLCYTNHALDQFLEGILKIKKNFSRDLDIVRIGGRCKTKNFKLKECILTNKIEEVRSQRALPKDLYKESSRLKKEIRSCQEQIQRAQKSVAATESKDKIFKLSTLKDIIHPTHFFQLTGIQPTQRGREIDVWLKLWYSIHQLDEDENEPLNFADEFENEHYELDDEESGYGQSGSDDEYIDVDAEAFMLEDERMMEGEEFELPMNLHILSELYYTAKTYEKRLKDDAQWNVAQISEKERWHRIRKGHSYQPMSKQEAISVNDIWKLSLPNRWSLYLHWVNELIAIQKNLIADAVRMYNEVCKENTKCRQDIDAFVIQDSHIIGMTTTGAAKYNHILSNIHPKIIIIEEAAEVFEAHVFTSLTPSVQQLIMIGDHKQLRPKANCYNLEKNYELCVSLFERLAKNGFPVFTLEVQHRMRPEIASIICPSIYEKLLNHDDVQNYEHIKGVGKDLFFIDHNEPEKVIPDKEKSHSNDHEASFLVALCKYLLKQGYRTSQITVLTMYRGQLLELKNRMRRVDYQGVRVAAVDDFQGEENDIILLSLVRSNSDGKIGFLKIENRICVSLSRAKMGLYVIGNLSMLRDKYDTVWPQIIEDLSKKGCVGDTLPLYCRNHPKTIVNAIASCSDDFKKCPEGGCQEKCGIRLDCGHRCLRFCHPVDTEHKLMKCKQSCPKVLECGHVCGQKCWKCIGGCLPCSKIVVKKIERCSHEIEMPCHENPLFYPCSVQCDIKLACGHNCQNWCSMPCTLNCRILVKKELPCGHSSDIPCAIDVKEARCNVPCDKLLDCGHKCSGNCFQCRRGRLHVRCQSSCGRTLVCSHECSFPCTPTCPPCMKQCNNFCVHSRCNRRCFDRCVPCNEPCAWKCEHHKCTRLCREMCDREPCNEPCKKILKCGHPCIGLCGEKCPSKCRICNRDEVCEILFGNEDEEDVRFIELEECQHVIEVSACDTWMAQVDDESKSTEVQFKTCPKCKTQIRKSLRYGNIIKKTLEDYENIKEKQLINLTDDNDIIKKLKRVKAEIPEDVTVHRLSSFRPIFRGGYGMEPRDRSLIPRTKPSKVDVAFNLHFFQPILRNLQDIGDKIEPPLSSQAKVEVILPPHTVNNINIQLSYLEYLVRIIKYLKVLESIITTSGLLADVIDVDIKDIHKDILAVLNFLMQDLLSDQQIADIQSEIYRLMSLIKLLDLWSKLKTSEKLQVLSQDDKAELTSRIVRLHCSDWKLNEEDNSEILQFIMKLSETYQVSGLTELERVEIIKAIGLTKGHWFKCPSGHYYCIGECGGAMEEATCPECGTKIGGQSHRLTEGNELAPEMDGARHAAWSEDANLENFDLDDLI
jgi:hypothetical protein